MRLIVTRPQPEADRWAGQFAQRGFAAVALPLIDIAPVDDAQRLARAWSDLHAYDALMFVSGAAVRHFFAAAPASDSPWTTPVWAPGAGTADALRAQGVPQACIAQPPADAASFDSEALWQVVGTGVRHGQRVLMVRGAGVDGEPAGRDWLSGRLRAAGARVDAVAAYRRALPHWGAEQRSVAQDASADGSVWLFSSSEAIGNLRTLVPECSWRHARALATHERIAQAARAAGFGVVRESRPALDALAAALESFG